MKSCLFFLGLGPFERQYLPSRQQVAVERAPTVVMGAE